MAAASLWVDLSSRLRRARDLHPLISSNSYFVLNFLERLLKRSQMAEARGYSRSVMPLDDLGCTRVTMLWIFRCYCARVYDEPVDRGVVGIAL